MMGDRDGRFRLIIRGVVQGVGFRPFVYRLAHEFGLSGWVLNGSSGVEIDVEGPQSKLNGFANRVRKTPPRESKIFSLELTTHDPIGQRGFSIRESSESGAKTVPVLADLSTCDACAEEIMQSNQRRFGYPFTNCTDCGPRFSIISSIPYDRPNTSMSRFEFCHACRDEYSNPLDRRFHAQPIACPKCGPALLYWNARGEMVGCDDVIEEAAKDLALGKTLAVKGLGGFHLMVDAQNDTAIERLRQKKPRKDKPFALMFPSVDELSKHCWVSETEVLLLTGPESPIVLLKKKSESRISSRVAPGNPTLGCMLPYTPLHVLLMNAFGRPVVATSGNLSDEPICIDNEEAVLRLGAFVDRFVVHNRPIVRHVDDSIVRVLPKNILVLRRARGFAPLPIHVGKTLPSMLATGSDLKNVVGISRGQDIVLSQHIGDLETKEAFDAFVRVIEDFGRLFQWKPEQVVSDSHPGYVSRRFAEERSLPHVMVQHHHAHMVSCMVENGVTDDVLGVIWDGTGYGLDGTIWGGEFLLGNCAGFSRVAHFKNFGLVGGDAAIHEPRRVALGVLQEVFGEVPKQCTTALAFKPHELSLCVQAMLKHVNTVMTSSVGRLFDAVSSMLGLHHYVSFEGQAAMALEYAAQDRLGPAYPFEVLQAEGKWVVDWRPMVCALLQERDAKVAAQRFHGALVEMIVCVAKSVGCENVVLSGGVFQNALLLTGVQARLSELGFKVFSHQRIPPNDGGIAVGQLMVACCGGEIRRSCER